MDNQQEHPKKQQPTLGTKVLDFVLLRSTRIRRAVSVVVGLIFLGIVIFNTFSDLIKDSTVIRINGLILLFFVTILLEEVSNSRTQLSDYLQTLVTSFHTDVYENESYAKNQQIEFITHHDPAEVRLIEYSTGSIKDLLMALSTNANVKSVRILMCHPESAINEYERVQRILSAIPFLARKFPLRGMDSKLRVRCYKTPASIRGINYDNKLIALGWYTYDIRLNSMKHHQKQLWGDENPIIISSVDTDQGKKLEQAFNEIFDRLWLESDGLENACRSYLDPIPDWPSKIWLKAVSRK